MIGNGAIRQYKEIRQSIIDSIHPDGTIDFDVIHDDIGECLEIYSKQYEGDPRCSSIKMMLEEIGEDAEDLAPEPYEYIRKMALVTNIFNTMAHMNLDTNSNNRQLTSFLFAQKDDMFLRITQSAFKINETLSKDEPPIVVCAGLDDRKKPTFVLELPYIGRCDWHFGSIVLDSEQISRSTRNLYGFFENIESLGIPRSKLIIDDKIKSLSKKTNPTKKNPESIAYTIADVLCGILSVDRLNSQDRKIVKQGHIPVDYD